MVVCEASGGYEQSLTSTCRLANISFHVAHANKVRAFAKSQELLAKTNQLDAKVLSSYGRVIQLKADSLFLSENEESIKKILDRHTQLQKEKLREQNRLEIKKMKLFLTLFKHI